MNTGELIDRVLYYTDNVDPDDADYATRRQKVLEIAQDVFNEVWNHKPWPFKQDRTVLSVLAGTNTVTAPTGFSNVSRDGGVYLDSMYPLKEVQPQVIDTIKESTNLFTQPSMFAVAGFDGTTQRQVFKFDSDGAFDVTLLYERACPLLADRATAPTATVGAAGNVTGTVRYMLTSVTRDGYEHETGMPTSITLGSPSQVSLTNLALGDSVGTVAFSVTSRKLYRTTAGGGTYKLLATLGDVTTASYTDNTADGSLGAGYAGYSTLLYIPQTFHFTVLLPGVIARVRRVKGDTRDWKSDYAQGLAAMVDRLIQRRSGVNRLPHAIPGRAW